MQLGRLTLAHISPIRQTSESSAGRSNGCIIIFMNRHVYLFCYTNKHKTHKFAGDECPVAGFILKPLRAQSQILL